MLQVVVSGIRQLLADLRRLLRQEREPVLQPTPPTSIPGISYQPLERVVLTDGVGRTLFEEYASHRKEARGEEETGWVLMGLRKANEAVVLATLPAGAGRDAGVAHVLFNSRAQGVGSRIVRQGNRRLMILGVVHTHPGSLRHPSEADYRGDSQWVRNVRGGEGIFGIGTADNDPDDSAPIATQPRPHVQCLGELRLSWYALGQDDRKYRPMPVELTLGPDLARPLHDIWPVIEHHAEALDRLYRQQAGITFQSLGRDPVRGLLMSVPLAEPGDSLQVLLTEEEIKYFLVHRGDILAVDESEERIDRAVYLLLAKLTG